MFTFQLLHGFDADGKNYNEKGMKVKWWPTHLDEIFFNRSQCFSNQYVNPYVNNQAILSENIADHGGLQASISAFNLWPMTSSVRLPGLEDLSPKQLLFLGYARSFCSNTKSQALEFQQMVDVHSPSHERINLAVKNSPIFTESFKCSAKSKLAFDKEQNCILW